LPALLWLLFYYAGYENSPESELDEVGDAADDAYKTMNKHIRKAERAVGDAIDPALG
jgi:hypothetical protein